MNASRVFVGGPDDFVLEVVAFVVGHDAKPLRRACDQCRNEAGAAVPLTARLRDPSEARARGEHLHTPIVRN